MLSLKNHKFSHFSVYILRRTAHAVKTMQGLSGIGYERAPAWYSSAKRRKLDEKYFSLKQQTVSVIRSNQPGDPEISNIEANLIFHRVPYLQKKGGRGIDNPLLVLFRLSCFDTPAAVMNWDSPLGLEEPRAALFCANATLLNVFFWQSGTCLLGVKSKIEISQMAMIATNTSHY